MNTWLKAVFIISTALGPAHVPLAASAQSYPDRPIRLIVPFAPGGPPDIVGRMLAQKLTETFKQTVVVDNRPGAGGAIGAEIAMKANPDGHTLLMASAAYAANAAIYKQSYDPVNDVTPVALIGESGFLVTLQPSVPVTSIKELIAYDKASPGKLNYGSGGTGTANHLAVELFNQMAGTRMTHVPYKGTGPALNDLLGGQIQLIVSGMLQMIPQIKSNRLRGIAVTTAKRSSAVPDIPTVAETVPDYGAVSWVAVVGPKAMPKDATVRLNAEINRTLQLSDIKSRMAGAGMEPVGGSPERFREVLKREVATWQRVVRVGNIKPDS